MKNEEPLQILAVCLGNVFRSPMMERLLRNRMSDGTQVESAGLMAVAGAPMDRVAGAELTRLGGTGDGFSARDFQCRQATDADLILTATAAIKSRVLEECPSALRRTFTLLEFAFLVEQAVEGTPRQRIAWAGANRSLAAGRDRDIIDPIGQPPEIHREAAEVIDEATRVCAEALSPR